MLILSLNKFKTLLTSSGFRQTRRENNLEKKLKTKKKIYALSCKFKKVNLSLIKKSQQIFLPSDKGIQRWWTFNEAP